MLKKYKMHIDRNTGIIEMFMDKLLDEDEGTYTFQLQDGRATGHSTLVLIGDGKDSAGSNWRTLLLPLMRTSHGTKVGMWKGTGTFLVWIPMFEMQFSVHAFHSISLRRSES